MSELAKPVPTADLRTKRLLAQDKLPKKGLYRVTGKRLVGGKGHGEIVELEMTDDQIKALIYAGHITLHIPEIRVIEPPVKLVKPEGK